jgi:hypothetical protein
MLAECDTFLGSVLIIGDVLSIDVGVPRDHCWVNWCRAQSIEQLTHEPCCVMIEEH